MLEKSDTPITEAMKFFATYNIEATYVVPTATGLSKSILDAHASLRNYFKSKNIHDFSSQKQGEENKVILNATLVSLHDMISTKVSIYRPNTKSGDPRLWISKLHTIAQPNNLIAIFLLNGSIYVLNFSDKQILLSAHEKRSPLNSLIQRQISSQEQLSARLMEKIGAQSLLGSETHRFEEGEQPPEAVIFDSDSESLVNHAENLIEKLKTISLLGYVESKRSGDTGVGMTLETLLGIKANSSRTPDFNGIEIKASRKGSVPNRVNLFSQVPNWKLSTCKSGKDILEKCGYIEPTKNRLQLYCTNSISPNAQGLFLKIDDKNNLVESKRSTPSAVESIVVWDLDNLVKQLRAKHKSTFWVKAMSRKDENGKEHFHYVEVEMTESPFAANFSTLIEIGAITMDYTLSMKDTRKARDHGYLFKILPQNLDLLFPKSRVLSLTLPH